MAYNPRASLGSYWGQDPWMERDVEWRVPDEVWKFQSKEVYVLTAITTKKNRNGSLV